MRAQALTDVNVLSQQSGTATTRLFSHASIPLGQHCTKQAHDADGRAEALPYIQTSTGTTKPHLLLRDKSERSKEDTP